MFSVGVAVRIFFSRLDAVVPNRVDAPPEGLCGPSAGATRIIHYREKDKFWLRDHGFRCALVNNIKTKIQQFQNTVRVTLFPSSTLKLHGLVKTTRVKFLTTFNQYYFSEFLYLFFVFFVICQFKMSLLLNPATQIKKCNNYSFTAYSILFTKTKALVIFF